MTDNLLFTVFKKLNKAGREVGTKIAVMGGMAVSIYAPPRATLDIDGIIDLKDKTVEDFLKAAAKQGFHWDVKNPVNSIKGLLFLTLFYPPAKVYIDLFLAQSDFQQAALARSRTVEVGDVQFEVVSPEDLILVKLISDRPRDTEDVRRILLENTEGLDFAYLNKWAGRLGVLTVLKDELRSIDGGEHKDE